MRKKLWTAAVILLLVCLGCGIASASNSGTCGSGVYWELSSDRKTLTISGSGAMWDFEMTEDQPWYDADETITKVIIGNSITYIGDSAFSCISHMSGITIPDSVTGIGAGAFSGCSALNGLTIPGSVETIGESAFFDCSSLTSLKLSNGIMEIGSNAFKHCPMTSVTIPKSVTAIGAMAFAYCRQLKSFSVNSGSSSYTAADGVLYNKAKTELCAFPCGISGTFTVPVGVTVIGDGAFYGTTLTHVYVPGSVTDIGEYAFSSCSLNSVSLQPGIEYIRRYAFSWSSLTSIRIPDGVTKIGNSAFDGCGELTSVTIPDSVTEIGYSAFYNCKKLKSIVLPKNLEVIPSDCFTHCSDLAAVTIPDGVKTIRYDAFRDCGSLTHVTLPPSVASVESDAFDSCWNLKRVDVLNKDAILTSPFNTPLVLSGFSGSTAEAYAAGDSDITFQVIQLGGSCGEKVTWMMIDDTLMVYGEGDMYNYTSGNTPVTDIRDDIQRIVIENGVASVGNYMFEGCCSLQELSVPGSVSRIGQFAFCWSAMTRLELSYGVESIGVGAFSGCTNLRSVEIPLSVKSLWNGCLHSHNPP